MKKRKTPRVGGQLRDGGFECRVDKRGRITLPKSVREHMRLKPGDRIQVTIYPLGRSRIGSDSPDCYYAELKRLKGTISKSIDLEF